LCLWGGCKIFLLKKRNISSVLAIILIAFFNIANSSSANAVPPEERYWVADINNCPNNKCLWSHSQNWAASFNGPSGASAPTAKNFKVFFNARSTVDAYLDLDIKKIKTLTIGNNYTGTLHLDGYHLQVQGNIATKGGDISIDGTATAPYTGQGPFLQTFSDLYIYNGGTVTANGNVSRIKVKKNLKIAGTLTAPNGNNSRFIVRGGFNLYSGGTFNHNSGTVLMNPRGTGYTINIEDGPGTNRNFYNLEKTANRTLTLSNDIEIENDFLIRKGIVQAQSHDITIKGNWGISQASNFQPGTGNVIFEGSSLQTIDGPTNFKALTISSPNVSLLDNTNVSNTLKINSGGSLDVNGKTLIASTLVNGGKLQLSGSESLNITTKDIDTGTITYDGTATGLNYGNTYFNLELDTSGTMTLNADLDVNGDLIITNGTLDVSNNNRNINVAGDWSNSGTFISRSGMVTFDGSSTVTTGGIANAHNFHHVTLSGTSAIQSTNAIDIEGNFTINSTGTWNTNNLCMTVNGTTTTGSGSLINPIPTLSSSTPSDNATGVAVDANIVLTFSEAVDVESGNITIKKSSDNSTVESIDVTSGLVTGSGTNQITINPTNNFASLTGYYLNIDATAFDDGCSNSYAGITDATTLNFTSADVDAPTLSSSTPSDNATGVAVDANIVLTFSKAVDVESGNITIKKSSDNSTVESIDVTSGLVTGSGTNQITINPTNNFASLTGYYLNIDATAFDDDAGNSYAGITDATTLNFTSADVDAPTLSSSTPSDNATGVAVDANIVLTFSEAVDVESGNITIKKSSDNSTVESIDVTSGLVTGSGTNQITINPTNNFASLTGYYLNIDATAFDDGAGNSYAGITDATTLNFTSADVDAPTLSSSTPSDNATGVAVDANIVLTFSEAVDVESGNITIKKSSDNSTVESIDVTSGLVTGSGTNQITINPTNNFASLTGYYLNIDATAFDDGAGNSYAGITDATTLNFTSADVDAPTLSSSTPSDNATGVAVDANIVLTFSEAVDVESGNITIKKSSDNSTVESIDVTSGLVTGSGTNQITINPTNNFASLTGYYLNIDATAFDDGAGNSYAGITDATTLNFTSADVDAPTLSSSTPSDNATGVAVDANIVLTFSEAVDVESGNITIKKSSDNSTVESIDVTSGLVTGSGTNQITINPTNNFASLTGYYLNIDATAFDDGAGNSYAGITDATTLNFTSADVDAPTLSSSTPSDNATGVAVDANIVLTFSEAVDVESGNITIKKSSDNSTVESIDVTSGLVTGSGTNQITINPTNNFASLTGYYLNIDATAFDDSASNSYAGITDATTLNFTSADVDAPTLSSSTPSDNATGVAVDANIVLTFSKAVDVESGNITIKKSSDNSTVESIDVTSTLVAGTGTTTITINPTNNFASLTGYYLNIDATAFDDGAGNSYAGITNVTTLNFTSADVVAPTLSSSTPSDNATGVAVDANIVLTFSEAVDVESGNITIKKSSDNSTVESIDVTSTLVAGTGTTTITINPTNNFASLTAIT
jgi:methionine-rich copper-binding protein CopC